MKKIILFLGISLLCAGVVYATTTATPGTEDDPIVTKSYVDKMINELKEELGKTSNKENETDTTEKITEFKVVNLTAGQTLTCNGSTQVIVRKGISKVTSPHESGISDLTGGKDILAGENVEENHLLLVPRTDGRGLIFETDSIILVYGEYNIN